MAKIKTSGAQVHMATLLQNKSSQDFRRYVICYKTKSFLYICSLDPFLVINEMKFNTLRVVSTAFFNITKAQNHIKNH